MDCFDFKSFLDIVKKMLPRKDSSNEYLVNSIFSWIAGTKIYFERYFDNTRAWADSSAVSRYLSHERNIPDDITTCAMFIQIDSEDFEIIEKSFEKEILRRIGSEDKKRELVNKMLIEIEMDHIISKSDKMSFQEAAHEKTPANFLTRVLLYLFRNDHKLPKEQKGKKENKEGKTENSGSDSSLNNSGIVYQNTSYMYNNNYDMSVTNNNTENINITNNNTFNIELTHHEIHTQFIENNDRKSSVNETEDKQKITQRNLNYINAQKKMNIIENIKNNSEKNQKQVYPDHINLNCYNLLVVEAKEFKVGFSLISKDINEKYIEGKLMKRVNSPAFSKEKVLKKYPSLFIPTRVYDEENRIPADQYAYIGFVDDYIECPDWEIIQWHYIAMIPLQKLRICGNHFALVDMDNSVTEMDVPHWALKNRDLFYHAKNAFSIQFPMIPNMKGVVPCIHIEYKGFNEGFTLNFIYYYYGGDFNNTLTKMIKTLEIPVLTTNRIFDQKQKEFVFDRQDIETDKEFTDLLPDISLLTSFISKIPQKYIPRIQVTPRILGHNLYWQNCKLIERGATIDIWAPDARVEADNKEQSIGELLEAILRWLIKEKIVNKSEAKADLKYLKYQ